MSTERSSDSLLSTVLIVLAVIVLCPLLLMTFAVPMMEMMGWWRGGGMGGGLSPLWGIGMMVVWLVVLVGLGYLFYRGFVRGVGSSMTGDRTLEDLRLAYDRGDPTDEEYEQRKDALERDT